MMNLQAGVAGRDPRTSQGKDAESEEAQEHATCNGLTLNVTTGDC
jgi:hypothetical protein